MIPLTIVRSQWGRYNLPIYIYIYGTPPQDRPFCCLDFFDTYPTCNGVAMPLQVGWIQDSRFKIPTDSFQQILNPGFKIQDSQRLFWANLESKSWIQPLDSRFKIQDSWGLFPANLESRIRDSRFKIPRDSLQEILNPGFRSCAQPIPVFLSLCRFMQQMLNRRGRC